MYSSLALGKQKTSGGPAVVLRAAKLALDYERARASTPVKAIGKFLGRQKAALARVLRIGLHSHIELSRLELECARAGLGFAKTRAADELPWCLPAELSSLPTEALPPHPLVDSAWLTELVSELPADHPRAVSALRRLLAPGGLEARWAGIPRVEVAGLPIPGNARVAVCLHLFYPEMWPAIRSALEAIPEPWDLYVSVPDFACTHMLAQVAKEHPAVRFLTGPNRGRDVLPFLRLLEMGVFDRYDAVCKLHSKRSPHMKDGERWLAKIMDSLVGSVANVSDLLERLRITPEIGLIGPRELLIDSNHPLHRGRNERSLADLAARAKLPKNLLECPFFAGTMFWFRPPALTGLRGLALRGDDFPIEMAQTDGTMAHALERLIAPLVEQAGYRIESVNADRDNGDVLAFMAPVKA